jgi:hypothetical protein
MSTVAHNDSTVIRTARARKTVAIGRAGDDTSSECPIAIIVYPHVASRIRVSIDATPSADHEDDSEHESVVLYTGDLSAVAASRHEWTESSSSSDSSSAVAYPLMSIASPPSSVRTVSSHSSTGVWSEAVEVCPDCVTIDSS